MRLAYICKRQYMGHDVIADRYARLYEQPRQLARRGHEVLGLCLSYRPTDTRDETHDSAPGRLHWVGLSPGSAWIGSGAYALRSLKTLRTFAPNVVIGASDAPHIVLGSWLAKRLGVPFAADLYDHFESFGLSHLPGMIPLYRRALRRAAVVTCVSDPLADLVRNGLGAKGRVLALPSTIDHGLFYPRDREASRKKLGLPQDAKLIGSAGGLSQAKGIEPLYRAFEILAEEDSSLHLALAGSLDSGCPPPRSPRVHYLGRLAHAQVPHFFSALDVGVVCLRDTTYGRYSFPQKAYEMAACGIPMAVARVGAMATLFGEMRQALYEPEDALSLAACIRAQQSNPELASLRIPDWAELATVMDEALVDAVGIQNH